jgi:pilus assembly protein CpaF
MTASFGRRRLDQVQPPSLQSTPLQSAPAASAHAPALLAPPPEAVSELRQLCLARIEPGAVASLPPDRLVIEVERLLGTLATERRLQLNAREQQALAADLVNDMIGLGPIETLLDDPTINDIMINGPHRIFVEQHGRNVLSPVKFRDVAHLSNVCQRIAAAVGRRIDEASPMVDARLKDGSRVNIVFPPLALDGPYVSIRKFSKKAIGFEQLIGFGALTPQVARILELAARARLNIVISGGTGSGKTTLMNALSQLIDPAERVVTVEDAAELQLQQPHVVRLETRPTNLEGKGEVTQRDLVRNALRMRPDRVIIGEVRAGEAFDMLQAMNTGHDGSMSTIHANTTRDALTRIENMVQMGNMGLPSAAIRQQIVGAVHLIVQVERHRDGGRRITQVSELCGMEGQIVLLNDIFQYVITGENAQGRIVGHYTVSKARPSFMQRLVYFGLDKQWMQALGAEA